MWGIQCFFDFIWGVGKDICKNVETSISNFFASNRYSCRAFMTVEASFIMIVILLSLASILQLSFFVHDSVVGSTYLHRVLEIERRTEKELQRQKKETKENLTGLLFSGKPNISISENLLSFEGILEADNKKIGIPYEPCIISVKKFEPEEFMRLTSAFWEEKGGDKGEDGGIFSERDST